MHTEVQGASQFKPPLDHCSAPGVLEFDITRILQFSSDLRILLRIDLSQQAGDLRQPHLRVFYYCRQNRYKVMSKSLDSFILEQIRIIFIAANEAFGSVQD